MTNQPPEFALISASCTTGWLDWVWGELWLAPDGLLRRSRGWKVTMAQSRRGIRASLEPTVPADPLVTRPYEPRAIEHLRQQGERIVWVARQEIIHARLRRCILQDALRLGLVDGSRLKLLWLSRDPAADVLDAVLGNWLETRFEP